MEFKIVILQKERVVNKLFLRVIDTISFYQEVNISLLFKKGVFYISLVRGFALSKTSQSGCKPIHPQ